MDKRRKFLLSSLDSKKVFTFTLSLKISIKFNGLRTVFTFLSKVRQKNLAFLIKKFLIWTRVNYFDSLVNRRIRVKQSPPKNFTSEPDSNSNHYNFGKMTSQHDIWPRWPVLTRSLGCECSCC